MVKHFFIWRTPLELTDNKEIIEIFLFQKIKILESDMIDKLKAKSNKIGEGAPSVVYKVENIFFHKGFLALKILKNVIFRKDDELKTNETKNKSDWNEEEELGKEEEIKIDFDKVNKLYAEYEFLFYLKHPNIIKTYGFYFGDKTHDPAILLEYCKFNLENAIKKLEDFELVGIIYEICSAMKYVHDNKIIHRDLKMSNILVNIKKHVKICDFGIAKSMDLTTYTSMTHGVGTLAFMAPELFIENSKYSEKVDVYSFGVIMYFIVTKGKMPPFSPAGYESFKLPETINTLSQRIIKSCWSNDPKNRPSFDEIIQLIIKNNFMLFNGIQSKIPQIKEHLGI